MHRMDRIFDGVTTSKVSELLDLRDFTNMSCQIKGLGTGESIQLYASLFEVNDPSTDLLLVKVEDTYTLAENRIYIIPPIFRFYQFRLTKTSTTPTTAYIYSVTDGSFIPQTIGGGGDTKPGEQNSGTFPSITLTNTSQTIYTLPVAVGKKIYTDHANFALEGPGVYIEVVFVEAGTGTIYPIATYILDTFTPTIVDNSPSIEVQRDLTKAGEVQVNVKAYCNTGILKGRIDLRVA